MKPWLLAGLLVVAVAAEAADKPNGRMQACTQQWQETGRTEAYKPFLKRCLSSPVAVKAKLAKSEAKPRKVKAAAVKKAPRPNRMKICGAEWQKRKAEGATGGQTWREFSKQCLKT